MTYSVRRVDYVVVGFDAVSYCADSYGWLCDLVGSLASELRALASSNQAEIAASDATEVSAGSWHLDLVVPYLPRFQVCRFTVARRRCGLSFADDLVDGRKSGVDFHRLGTSR
jgi:hypothetical protein